jgi:hypothetical protein
MDLARWFLAGSTTVAMAVLTIGSRYVDAWHVCRTILEGRRIFTESCGPYAISDLTPGLLIVGLLLLPDIDELVLPGLGSLRMCIREQESRAAGMEAKMMQLEQQNSLRSMQSQNVNLTLGRAEADPPGSLRPICHPTYPRDRLSSALITRRAATRASCRAGHSSARSGNGYRQLALRTPPSPPATVAPSSPSRAVDHCLRPRPVEEPNWRSRSHKL